MTLTIDNKAIALANLGKNVQALKLFYKSVSMNKKDVNALYNIGVILDHLKNYTGAFTIYAQAQNLTPHNIDVLWNEGITLGVVLLRSNHFADAVKVYDTMLKVAPHNSYLLQARNYAKSKLFESMCCVGGSSLS